MAIRVVTTSPGFATAGDLAERIAARGWELIHVALPDRAEAIFRDPKVIVTPPSGADTTGALLRMGRMILEDIDTILAGGRSLRLANPEVVQWA